MTAALSVHSREHRAFSLIEVTLALGVIAFALVAILGVFPIGLASDRSNVSETRAAQIANAIIASIDAQCNRFTVVDCFGLTLNLASLNNFQASSAGAVLLYAKYPAGYSGDPARDEPQISTDPTDAIYTVELRFENDPVLAPEPAPTGTRLGPGKLSRIQILVRGKSATANPITFQYLARNKQ